MLKKFFAGMVLIYFMSTISLMAQIKIAYVDIMKIREEYQEFKNAEITFQKEMESVQTRIKNKEMEIQSLQKEIEAQSMLLSEEKKKEKEKKYGELVQQYQSMVQEEQEKASRREGELLEPIQKKLKIAINNVAVKEGFDFVLDISNLYYGKDAWDVTNQVIRELGSVKLPLNNK